MPRFPGRGLYVITDCERMDFDDCLLRTRLLLDTGIAVLQFRDKAPDYNLRLERALALAELCHEHGTFFIINDDISLALETGVQALHIGRDDPAYGQARSSLGATAVIGVSCYNELERAQEFQLAGADYVAFGAFFSTGTKTGTVHAGIELLRAARPELHIPVVAIGGITPANGRQLVEAGADMLAVISSVYNSEEPEDTVRQFYRIFDR